MHKRLLIAALLIPIATSAEEPATQTPALWGTPTVDGGKCCATLGEVRDNLDRLDRQIVQLMAERGRYVHEAARFKANPAQVDAPERAQAVIRKAITLAELNGLPPEIAEATYKAMIGAFTQYEQAVFAKAATSK